MILSIGWIVLNACGPKEIEVETVKPTVETSVAIPTPTEAKPFSPPQPDVFELNGGGELWLLEDHDLPLVVFSIVLPGGSAQDPQDKLGQAELANQMLLEAAGGFTASEISNAFYELAADVSIQTTRQHSILQVSAHRDRLSDVLSYVSKMVFEPTFNDADWTRVQDMHLASLKQSRQDSSWVASQYTGYFLYGAEHPLGRAVRGTPKTIESVSKSEAMQWHQDRLKGGGAHLGIVAVGDLDQATVEGLVEQYFANFPALDLGDIQAPQIVDAAIPTTSKVVLVDMPGAEQTSIRLLSPAYDKSTSDPVPTDLAGVVMGGTFTSRLNAKLREEKGYTYGAGCSFYEGYYGNHLSVRTNVQTKFTTEAITDLRAVLSSAQDGFTADERQKAVSAYRADFVQMSSSRRQLASDMVDLFRLGDVKTSWSDDLSTSQNTTIEDMNAMAKYFNPSNGITLLVGDATTVKPMLEAAGIDFEEGNIPE